MGVSGSGKTTIGKLLADTLNIPFYDADDYHPKSNILKMSNGIPLNDDDRLPWLQILNSVLVNSKESGAVLACSALKEKYREILSKDIGTEWVYLKADIDLIATRMAEREDHFMPVKLLQSQFDVLEEPTYGIHLDVLTAPNEIVHQIKQGITNMEMSEIGLYGLGVMGKSLAQNILDHGFSLSVYNIETSTERDVVSKFVKEIDNKKLIGFSSLEK